MVELATQEQTPEVDPVQQQINTENSGEDYNVPSQEEDVVFPAPSQTQFFEPSADLASKSAGAGLGVEESPEPLLVTYDSDLAQIREDKDKFLDRKAAEAQVEAVQQQQLLLETASAEVLDNYREDIEILFGEMAEEVSSKDAGLTYLYRQRYPNATTEEVGSMVFSTRLFQEAEAFIKDEDYGALEDAWDTFKWFIVPTDLFDVPGTIFGPEGIAKLQALPIQEQLKLIPYLVRESLDVAGGNREKAEVYLTNLATATGKENANLGIMMSALVGLDVAAIAAPVAVGMSRALRTVPQLADMGERRAAAQLAVAALRDAQLAEALGLHPQVLATDMTPFEFWKVAAYHTDNLHREMLEVATGKNLEGYLKMREGFLAAISDKNALSLAADFDPVIVRRNFKLEMSRAQKRLKAELEATPNSTGTVHPTVIQGKVGFMINQQDALGNVIKNKFEVFQPTVNSSTGQWELPKVNPVKRFLFSPSAALNGMVDNLLDGAHLAVTQRSKISKEFKSARKLADAPITGTLKKKQRQDVERVLTLGDENQHIYTVEELKNLGVVDPETSTLIHLNDGQIDSYYRWRGIADALYELEDRMLSNKLTVQGLKEIGVGGGERMFGIPVPTAQVRNFLERVTEEGGAKVFDVSSQRFIDARLLKRNFEKMGAGKVVVDMRQWKPLQIKGKGYSDYLLIDASQIKKLPVRGLKERRLGYVPKINQGIEYVIKRHTNTHVNGVSKSGVDSPETAIHSTYSFKPDRDAALEKLETFRKARGDGDHMFVGHDDFEFIQTGDISIGSRGRLYTGARTSEAFLLNGESVPRDGAFKALLKNMEYVGREVPIHEWRLSMQKQFVNTINSDPKLSRIDNFFQPINGEVGRVKSAEFLRDYIRKVTNTPTRGERFFESKMRAVANRTHGTLPVAFRKTIMDVSHTDPIAAMRSLSFNAYLGWMNPAQLWVQAQIASIALSTHPVLGAKAMVRALPIVAVYFTRNKTAIQQTFQAAKKAGILTKGLEEDLRLMKRTGLYESLEMTGDHNSAIQGYGTVAERMRGASDIGLLPYKMGEGYGRTVAWLIAKDLWKKANPGKVLDEAAEKIIFKHQQRLTLRMTQSNQASWQSGLLALPTQFMQVQAKFIEQLLPRVIGGKSEFTVGERFRLLVGQMALYGSVGIPGGKWLLNWAAEQAGVDPREMDPDMLNYARGGITSWITNGKVDAATRGAIAAGIFEGVLDTLDGETSVVEGFGGAFGSLLSREARAIRTVYDIARAPGVDAEGYLLALPELLAFVSSFRNAKIAAKYMYGMDAYIKNNGVIVPMQFEPLEYIAKGLGFTPQRVSDAYLQSRNAAEISEGYSTAADRLIKVAGVLLDADDPDVIKKQTELYRSLLSGYNDHDRIKIMGAVARKIRAGVTQQHKTIQSAMMTEAATESDRIVSGAILNRVEED